jgi:hypothetical protein
MSASAKSRNTTGSTRKQQTARDTIRTFVSSQNADLHRSVLGQDRRALAAPGARRFRRNKFRAIRTVIDGFTFDSKAEATYYGVLKLMGAAGQIRDLELQPSFDLHSWQGAKRTRVCRYVADFRYIDANGVDHVVDVKGRRLPIYSLKKKMMLAEHGIAIEEINAREVYRNAA